MSKKIYRIYIYRKEISTGESVEEAERWMKKAESDFSAAEINFQQELYEVSAFLAHQSTEKALKSLYILKFKRLWKIHDLFELGKKVEAPEYTLKFCEKLNPHYLATRYPMDEDYTEKIAKEALESAKKVIEWAKEKMQRQKK